MGEDGKSRPARAITRDSVVGGIVLGSLLAIAAQGLLFSLLPYLGLEQTGRIAYTIYWIPTLVVTGSLLSRRTRRIRAGLVLGLSIGTILSAGGCTLMDVAT